MMPVPQNPTFIGLDVETAPVDGHPVPFALQPWRYAEGTARMTSLAISKTNSESKLFTAEYQDAVDLIPADVFVAVWNGVFDIAWLLVYGIDISKLRFVDAKLLWKHYSNSQYMEHGGKWNLKYGAKAWLDDLYWCSDFIDMKNEPFVVGQNDAYWEQRAGLDSFATALIAERVWAVLTDQQRRLAIIESRCLVPFAQSWLDGVPINSALAEEKAPVIINEMRELEEKLDLVTPPTNCKKDRELKLDGWIPSKILSSPKQLACLIYDTWGFECNHMTAPSESFPEGQRAANKTALTYLTDSDPRFLDILRWRKINTELTKFIRGLIKTVEYLGSNISHPTPNLFSTYTGRVTYSSRSGSKGELYKAKIGIPLHQMPREKEIRKLIPASL